MSKQQKILIFLLLVAFTSIAAYDKNKGSVAVPDYWPEPILSIPSNDHQATIYLGRVLFYDPILSRNRSVSCSSCHSSYNAFAHSDHALSHGIDNLIGTRNAPALMNLAWQSSFMTDGSITNLDLQALTPIQNPKEMDSNMDTVIQRLQQTKAYAKLFAAAYNDTVISQHKVLHAIAQFLLTLISSQSKYDSVIQNQATFTLQENNGYVLFKKNCVSCHTEPLFTNYTFQNIGLPVDTSLRYYGRYSITHLSSDSFKFKVPTLRNIAYTFPYMHDGRFKKLSDVVKHYANGIHQSTTLAPALKQSLVLSANERVDLVAFLLTLSDRSFLFNEKYGFPRGFFFPTASNR